MTQEPFSIDSMLRHCAENRQRTLSALPNVGLRSVSNIAR